jgi:hypothetical protein
MMMQNNRFGMYVCSREKKITVIDAARCMDYGKLPELRMHPVRQQQTSFTRDPDQWRVLLNNTTMKLVLLERRGVS